ncbi:MAG TPA: hypothetical protein VMR62_03560 [Bryobacteraceae bacterium]|jgi:hypothetical protein|nr:hypothetical protein [Bryobacteraceae bacterium]
MKRAVLVTALLLSAAGLLFLQTAAPPPKLATLMPRGALLYLEAPDFGSLLHEWDTSRTKAAWLGSENYAVFSHSNLFMKLHDLFGEYGTAAGFRPTFSSALEIAGTDSALALYGIRDVEFLYISRIGSADLMKTQLWAVRDKFEQRQAGGLPFYLRLDAASKRTVAFAFAKGYLLLGTRDDLVARALELLAGGSNPSIAADPWYRESTARARTLARDTAQLRLVMNLQALVKSEYFRSYWVHRNASEVRQYWAGLADVTRTSGAITESRIFLRAPDAAASDAASIGQDVSGLVALVPPEAGLYNAAPVSDSSAVATLIVQKLIASQPQAAGDWRAAPMAVSPDTQAGSEGDLETRIDEQPLPPDAGISDSVAAVRAMVDHTGCRAMLLIQSTSPASATFVRMPAVLVLYGTQNWEADAVRASLTAAAGKLWTTSQLGTEWVTGTAGQHSVERLDGLGKLSVAVAGRLLYLANDANLLAAVLDRAGALPPAGAVTYAAGFRHSLERANYERVMIALDFNSSGGNAQSRQDDPDDHAPPFFSGNMGSLSRVLSHVAEVRITQEEKDDVMLQTVVYRLAQ